MSPPTRNTTPGDNSQQHQQQQQLLLNVTHTLPQLQVTKGQPHQLTLQSAMTNSTQEVSLQYTNVSYYVTILFNQYLLYILYSKDLAF
jgi:hypothetical protein